MPERTDYSCVLGLASGIIAALCSQSSWGMCHGRGLSVSNLVEITEFLGNEREDGVDRVFRSPDGKFVAVLDQRGDLGSNTVVNELLVWRVSRVSGWVRGQRGRPRPVARVTRSVRDELFQLEAAAIREVRWADDSRSLYFIAREPHAGPYTYGLYRTMLFGGTELLSVPGQDVVAFGTRNGTVVYEVAATRPMVERNLLGENSEKQALIVGTDHSLESIMFPTSSSTERVARMGWVHLWEIGSWRSKPKLVFTEEINSDEARQVLSVSPDGKYVVMDLPVHYVPARWMRYGYNPRYPVWARDGVQHLAAGDGNNEQIPHEYTLVDLKTGRARPLLSAPDALSRGFFGSTMFKADASWAPDGRAVLVEGAFLPLPIKGTAKGFWGARLPCLAVVDIRRELAECIIPAGTKNSVPGTSSGSWSAHWDRSMPDRLVVTPSAIGPGTHWVVSKRRARIFYCVQANADSWIRECTFPAKAKAAAMADEVHIWVSENLNTPPELVASIGRSRSPRILFDPNKKIRGLCRGRAQTVQLRYMLNGSNEIAEAGLLLPPDYVPSRRYPLVLQTHGFESSKFFGSGIYSAPFAGQALATAEMIVMQVPICWPQPLLVRVFGTPEEAQCSLGIYQAAIRYAVNHGLADDNRVGIIGFSRTCYTVLLALEDQRFHFAAAELSDGIELTYTDYLLYGGGNRQGSWRLLHQLEMMIGGAPPIGTGLPLWIERSPGFSVYKINAPLLDEADGPESAMYLWEPYAILRRLNRPVDLVLLRNRGVHPLANPSQRLAVQGITVDWFSFWLDNKKPASDSEYRRWMQLREDARTALRRAQ